MALKVLWAVVGGVLGLAGAWMLLRLRFGRGGGRGMRLAVVGEVSRVTLLVVGLSLLWAGYHVLAFGLGVMEHFRAPLGIALVVAVVAIVGSCAVDALENRLATRSKNGGE